MLNLPQPPKWDIARVSHSTLVNADCFDVFPFIEDKSIDAIICDLPYGVLNKGNVNAKWDSVIPFTPLWKQYERIIKDNGAIVLFGQGMFSAELMISNKKIWRYNLIWDKVAKTGFLNANKMPLRQHEDILIFYKKLCTYNPQMVKCEPHKRNHGKGKNEAPANSCYGKFISTPTIISDEKFPTSIISIPKPHKNTDYFHPTQKSIECLEYLIKTYTNEGDTVLDNTMGSGTTNLACLKLNRKSIGIEKEKQYYDVAVRRLSSYCGWQYRAWRSCRTEC